MVNQGLLYGDDMRYVDFLQLKPAVAFGAFTVDIRATYLQIL
jgi:hypothetical protein